MIDSLPLFHRIEGQKVLVLGDGAAAEPKKRLVERAGGIVERDMQRAIDEGVRLAFVAYEEKSACERAAIRLRCAGMLVNVVDMPQLCDFTTPSILDRNPVLVAIGTGGASAGLAKHLRLRLERILPPALGKLARGLFAAREELRASFPDGAARRSAIDKALREGGVLDPLRPDAARRIPEWLAGLGRGEGAPDGGESPTLAPLVEEIALPSADPEELTLRQARLLGEADILFIDGPVPEGILARARADARRIAWDASHAHGLPERLAGNARLALVLRFPAQGSEAAAPPDGAR